MPSDTIRSIEIRGFKSIASLDLKLKPINVIIGANGSGKSNFIGSFAVLREVAAGRLRNYVTAAGGAEKILHFGSKTTDRIKLLVSFSEFPHRDGKYDITLAPTSDDGLFPAHEKIGIENSSSVLNSWQQGREAGISDPEQFPLVRWLRQHIDLWQLYHLNDTSFMRKTASVADNDFLRADGSNLASYLYYLRENSGRSYSSVVRTVQQVAPFFGDFVLNPIRDKPDDIKLVWRHKRSDQYFDASSLSDGTLRFIALATLLLQPQIHSRSVILVDEPELGLHPYAIEVQAALIRQASVSTQVIVSTQSSPLLDHFEPEDVLVADRVDGGTQMRRLDSARLARWLEDYSLGQLWEKNEFGGRPVPG